MKKIMSRCLCVVLCVFALISLLSANVLAAEDAAVSDNRNWQNYTRWSYPVESYLSKDGDGYLRVEHMNGQLVIEKYDAQLNFVSSRRIALPLPLFGGVYLCEDANFVVCGQSNMQESSSQEVIRVIKYTKDWKEVKYASLKGANTTVPFDAGSLRFARTGDMLFIRTSHEMYTASDGLNHQANLTLRVDVSKMTILNSQYAVSNSGNGYCSHSFNQFIQVDGNTVLAVDHGDAYPRSVALFKYSSTAKGSSFSFKANCISVLPIVGGIGNNSTGVSVGGFEYSSTHYLVAGNSIEQVSGASFSGQRNIFVTATPKSNFSQSATRLRYITDYASDSGIACTTPHLIKIGADKFFLIWGVGDTVSYCFLNGKGEAISEIYSDEGVLSDCVPIVSGNSILWYMTDESYPVFYKIDLSAPEKVTMTHRHTFSLNITKQPGETTQGAATAQCRICKLSEDLVMPALNSGSYTVETLEEATCSSYGKERITWNHETFGAISYTQWIYPLDCTYGDWITDKEATCTERGSRHKVCTQCGYTYKETLYALGHDYTYTLIDEPSFTSTGVLNCICSRCPHTDTVPLPALSTSQYYRYVIKDATCTEAGTDQYTWWNTDYGTYSFEVTTEPKGHSEWSWTNPPTCTADGYTTYECYRCGNTYKSDYVDALGHTEVIDKAVAATCTKSGRTEGKHCSVCGKVIVAQQTVKATGHSYANGKCSVCGASDPYYVDPTEPTQSRPTEPGQENASVIRVFGADRYATAFKAADTLKEVLGVSKFRNIIVASGTGFADALAGSYLAAMKDAPILLVRGANVNEVKTYIRDNLTPGGTVYLLGGVNAVPKTMETGLDGFTVKRLGGANRYDTNLLILQEAGVGNKAIIVCTGLNFADSLSASATGLPILLVKDGLTQAQKDFLRTTSGIKVIVGGTNAVNKNVENQLVRYGDVLRLSGDTRYDTSVLVAQVFFDWPDQAVLAYAQNFPDGLSGGPLAYALRAPLILTDSNHPNSAMCYTVNYGIQSGYVMGGSGLISDKVVKNIFRMTSADTILVK